MFVGLATQSSSEVNKREPNQIRAEDKPGVHISRAAALPRGSSHRLESGECPAARTQERMAQRTLTRSFHSLCNHLFIE